MRREKEVHEIFLRNRFKKEFRSRMPNDMKLGYMKPFCLGFFNIVQSSRFSIWEVRFMSGIN
jgi:hypothetical protein